MTYGLTVQDLQQIIATLQSKPGLERAIIFGSRAMGNFKPGSDIDIALYGEISDHDLLSLKSTLEEDLPLPYYFDLILASAVESPSLLEHLATHGKVIYQK